MKKTAIRLTLMILLVSIILIGVVSASGFSPSSLIFNLVPGQQQCQAITLTSDSATISVADMWAENKDVEWKVSLFTNSASSHSISINYPTQLTTERTVNVCVAGTQNGEYHGVILLKEGQVGNSIVQMGVWLKVIIGQGSTSSGSGTQTTTTTASGSAQQVTNITNQTAITSSQQTPEADTTTQEQEQQTSIMTGGFLGTSLKNTTALIIFIAIIVVAFIIVLLSKKIRGYVKWKRYGY